MIALSLSIAFSRRSAELKASTPRTVGLEFTASRPKTAGAMGKDHMVQGKLAPAGAVHCLQRNQDTQTLGLAGADSRRRPQLAYHYSDAKGMESGRIKRCLGKLLAK